METARIKSIIESLLFVAREPLSLEELEGVMEIPQDLLFSVLEEMIAEMQARGIQIVKVAGGYLMGTNQENAEYVEKILHPKEETRLSPRTLETLAIIAYKQPVTKAEIERLRGVDSGWVIDSLIDKKLVKEVGRSDAVGHPYLYATTEEFLRHFGIESVSTLPPLPSSELEQENLFKSALHETQTVEQQH
ncbi:MAG: SMC-Scp complex subunit ScpB [bacterium]